MSIQPRLGRGLWFPSRARRDVRAHRLEAAGALGTPGRVGGRSPLRSVRRPGGKSGRHPFGGDAGVRRTQGIVRGDRVGCRPLCGRARLPVYLTTQWRDIAAVWPLVLTATAGVVIGTAFGARVLGRIPERTFRRIVAVLLLLLGIYMTLAGGR